MELFELEVDRQQPGFAAAAKRANQGEDISMLQRAWVACVRKQAQAPSGRRSTRPKGSQNSPLRSRGREDTRGLRKAARVIQRRRRAPGIRRSTARRENRRMRHVRGRPPSHRAVWARQAARQGAVHPAPRDRAYPARARGCRDHLLRISTTSTATKPCARRTRTARRRTGCSQTGSPPCRLELAARGLTRSRQNSGGTHRGHRPASASATAGTGARRWRSTLRQSAMRLKVGSIITSNWCRPRRTRP